MLIVCAIIMILMGLTLGAVMRYKDVQQKLNTQLTLQKVDSMLRQHWNAVINAANNEAIPPNIISMAGNDAVAGKRARVIYIKFRLRQEFPKSFSEVMSPAPGLTVKQSYVTGIQGAPSIAQGTLGKKFNIESSVCLYLALQQRRAGTNTNVDNILTSRETPTAPNSTVKYIVDDWKTPIAFFRWPYSNTDLNPGGNRNQNNDLEDPEGLLTMGGWNTGVFTQLCHPVNTSYRLDPTMASAGRDGVFGLDSLDSQQPPQSMATTNAGGTYDNLYSYRLRETGRGD
jgi:hypothetical protein